MYDLRPNHEIEPNCPAARRSLAYAMLRSATRRGVPQWGALNEGHGGGEKVSYCALGILSGDANEMVNHPTSKHLRQVAIDYGFPGDEAYAIINMNSKGMSFAEIADDLEAHYESETAPMLLDAVAA